VAPPATVLFLDDVPGASALQAALGVTACFANAPLEAAKLLADLRPTAVALGTAKAWTRELVESLGPGERPAVLAVGDGSRAARGLADQWIRPGWAAPDVRASFSRALARAQRRFRQSAGPLQPLGRSAFLRALVRTCDRRARDGGSTSVVLIRMDGRPGPERHSLAEAASLLRRQTRRSELCGRLNDRLFAVALSGGRASAGRLASRMRSLLDMHGVGTTSRCLDVDPDRPLGWLRRR